jgi:hypothetical protein
MRTDQQTAASELCYLDASKVTSPAGSLADLAILDCDGRPVGNIEGVIIDPAARRVRYFDVRSSGWLRRRRYLLEADQLAQVEAEAKALRLRVNPDTVHVRDLDADRLRQFSDDDLIAAVFSPQAA